MAERSGKTGQVTIGLWFDEQAGDIHLSLPGHGLSTVNGNAESKRGKRFPSSSQLLHILSYRWNIRKLFKAKLTCVLAIWSDVDRFPRSVGLVKKKMDPSFRWDDEKGKCLLVQLHEAR